ncbi:Hypothetical protein A7982_06429 [Minicystis rosea]|nr:Hypothetical protein A7982_06429 [Minicystis rosea]
MTAREQPRSDEDHGEGRRTRRHGGARGTPCSRRNNREIGGIRGRTTRSVPPEMAALQRS